MIAPREADGLGLGSLKALNLSLIVKWLWRLKTDGPSLWSKVIKGIHNLYNKPADHISKKNPTWCMEQYRWSRTQIGKNWN